MGQVAALAVNLTIEEYCREHEVECDSFFKWPNDIFLNDKKICGMLPEAEFKGQVAYSWVGIGVNLNSLPPSFQHLSNTLK
mmetsp:Transcript_11053/g.18485  ORF Transcript_11053/g.18485 Transcript_11053/m.18485 type:complete len:81 (-) Transcript_11053:323-565(-)